MCTVIRDIELLDVISLIRAWTNSRKYEVIRAMLMVLLVPLPNRIAATTFLLSVGIRPPIIDF